MAEWNEERLQKFTEGVRLCLSRWTGLQLAVDNQWGGRNSALKAQQLGEDVVGFMTQSKETYIDDLENMLDDNLMQQFNLELDDGSIEEVAETIMYLNLECSAGNFERIQSLSAPASGAQQSVCENQEENDNESDEQPPDAPEPMNIDESAPAAEAAPAVDPTIRGLSESEVADGWQVVTKGKGTRKRR